MASKGNVVSDIPQTPEERQNGQESTVKLFNPAAWFIIRCANAIHHF